MKKLKYKKSKLGRDQPLPGFGIFTKIKYFINCKIFKTVYGVKYLRRLLTIDGGPSIKPGKGLRANL